MSVYLGTQLLSGVATNTISNAHDLFDFKWVDHQLTDQSWLNADTFSWQDGTVYSDAYNHLNADYNGGTSTTETIGSYTITYVLADDGHKITTDETTVANIYAESGVAWYYVIDQANTRFKLPRTKYGFNGYRDAVGKYIPETLPNITGYAHFDQCAFRDQSGAFSGTSGNTKGISPTNVSATNYGDLYFKASDSSSVYQDSAPVQERATQMYLYFYVGQFSQSATEQTAGLNASLFNNKADLDLGNLDATGQKVLDGQWILPSSGGSIAVEVSANGSTDLEFDVSSLLPNDGYDYDVLISCIATTGSTSGNYVPVYVYSDLNSGTGRYICVCRPRTRSSSSVFGGGSITIPVGTGRKLYLIRSTSYNGTVSIDLRGYRRIGTNS